MKNIELLFEYNIYKNIKSSKRNVKLITRKNQKMWKYDNYDEIFSGNTICKLLQSLNYIIETDKFKLPIVICLNKIEFADKLVFIILECICYYIINLNNRQISIFFDSKKSIWTDGISYSPMYFLNSSYIKFNEKFIEDTNLKHYRRVVHYKHVKTDYLNHVSTDIFLFFEKLKFEDTTNEILCESIAEIVGNAIEHGHSDCLIDIDVTDEKYTKDDDSDSIYYGINVVVLNFSEKSFSDKLKKKLSNINDLSGRYKQVDRAYAFHSKFFNDKYTESDFYTIASFQHKISGSIQKASSGGVGLTHLINSIDEKAATHNCYMLSGQRVFNFAKELLQYDSNQYIGFNDKNDFFNHIPSSKILQCSNTHFPGTAYNLNFVIKKGEINNG